MSYQAPDWAGQPKHQFGFEVLKSGQIIGAIALHDKSHYTIGRNQDVSDIHLEHPSVSRLHAVVQHSDSGEVFLFDCGSTHGTVINKQRLKPHVFAPLHVGDVVKFGLSTRLHIVTGPEDLRPPEGPSMAERVEAKKQAAMLDAKREVQRGEVMWGQAEDAPEEEDDEVTPVDDSLNLNNLNDRQKKLFDKIKAKHNKIDHLQQEIDRIRAKEVGGLSDGQQQRLSVNTNRIAEIEEEVSELEEQLRESVMNRDRQLGKKKRRAREEAGSSDDDDFFDRTNYKTKRQRRKEQGEPKDEVDNEDTLNEKLEALSAQRKELEARRTELQDKQQSKKGGGGADPLEAYMIQTALQLDKTKLKELNTQLAALDEEETRLRYLLKVVTPAVPGFHVKKKVDKDSVKKEEEEEKAEEKGGGGGGGDKGPAPPQQERGDGASAKPRVQSQHSPAPSPAVPAAEQEGGGKAGDGNDAKSPAPLAPPPPRSKLVGKMVGGVLMLGHVPGMPKPPTPGGLDARRGGLQLRRKPTPQLQQAAHGTGGGEEGVEGAGGEEGGSFAVPQPKRKRVIGPSMPLRAGEAPEGMDEGGGLLDGEWKPPSNQTGDGRTALNDKLGY